MKEIGEEFDKNSKTKKGLIITLGAVLVLIVALCLVYFLVFSKPNYIFNRAVDKVLSQKAIDYNTLIANFEMGASIDSDNAQIKEVNNILKDCKLNFKTQFDKENQKEIVDLGFNYQNQDAISAKVYYNNGEEYVFLNDIFDKYIKLNITEEQKEQIKEIFKTVSEQKDLEKMQKILKKELKNVIKEQGEFVKESEVLEINGKDKKVTKNTLTMNQKQFLKAIQTVTSELSKNEEFLKCFKGSPKEMLTKISDKAKEVLDDEDYNTKSKIEIAIYTKGLLKEFAGINISVTNADELTEQNFAIIKQDKETYSFKANSKGDNSGTKISVEDLKGTLKIEKIVDKKEETEGKVALNIEISEAGTLGIEVIYKTTLNSKIDDIDVKNAINMQDITQNDIENIYSNLSKRPLIGELIENAKSLFTSANKAKDLTKQAEEEEEKLTSEIINKTTEKSTTKQNEIYNGYYKIEYSIPQGFEFDSEWSTDSYKYYNKGDYDKGIEAQIEIEFINIEDTIKSEMDSLKEFYDNVSLDTTKTLEVNGKKFNYNVINYENYGIKKQEVYAWYKINDENYFLVNLDATDTEVTEDIIKGFLNISIAE